MQLPRCGWPLVILLWTLPAATAGAAEDFHRLFEERCGTCHGHAGAFARATLEHVDGVLRGRKSGRKVAAFLPGHLGRLTPEQVALFVAVFARQIESGGLFQERCAICHVRARDLARASLVVVEGQLLGRYSGRDIEVFLLGHGRASETEAAELYRALLGVTEGRR